MTDPAALDQQWFDDVNRLARDTGWLQEPAALFATYGVLVLAALLVLGVLVAVGVNQPVAALVDHARPFATDPGVLTLVARSTDPSSPSDHATMAGAAAVGLWLVSRRLGVVAAVLAVVMAATRVYVGVHYPGDVLAGLVLGGVVSGLGWLLVRGPAVGLLERAATHPRLRPVVVADPREVVGRPA